MSTHLTLVEKQIRELSNAIRDCIEEGDKIDGETIDAAIAKTKGETE